MLFVVGMSRPDANDSTTVLTGISANGRELTLRISMQLQLCSFLSSIYTSYPQQLHPNQVFELLTALEEVVFNARKVNNDAELEKFSHIFERFVRKPE